MTPFAKKLTVLAVNGAAAAVGAQITLASGAYLTVNSDGTFAFDPIGAFDALNTGESDTDPFQAKETWTDGNDIILIDASRGSTVLYEGSALYGFDLSAPGCNATDVNVIMTNILGFETGLDGTGLEEVEVGAGFVALPLGDLTGGVHRAVRRAPDTGAGTMTPVGPRNPCGASFSGVNSPIFACRVLTSIIGSGPAFRASPNTPPASERTSSIRAHDNVADGGRGHSQIGITGLMPGRLAWSSSLAAWGNAVARASVAQYDLRRTRPVSEVAH